MPRPTHPVTLGYHDAALREFYATRSTASLAAEYGCNPSVVQKRIAALGLVKPAGHWPAPPQKRRDYAAQRAAKWGVRVDQLADLSALVRLRFSTAEAAKMLREQGEQQ